MNSGKGFNRPSWELESEELQTLFKGQSEVASAQRKAMWRVVLAPSEWESDRGTHLRVGPGCAQISGGMVSQGH